MARVLTTDRQRNRDDPSFGYRGRRSHGALICRRCGDCGHLFCLSFGHWLLPETVCYHGRGLLSGRPGNDRLGGGAGFCVGQPGIAGIAGLGGECVSVRHSGIALVLDRRDPGDGVPGHRDDAVLYISKTHSVPGYLQLRYGPEASALSAATFAVMTILMSGVNMYAMAVVMEVVLGWNLHFSLITSSVTVGIYVAAGGLFSAIFNEVLQFFLIWFGALLIPILGLIETGGWSGMVARIHQNFPGQDFTHLWAPMNSFSSNPMGIHWTGIVFGLGAVQAMGYWTTDFLVVQRVLSAKDVRSAKLAPIIGSFFKMAVPLIVIVPGLLGR